ncbi:MAG TPA: hypothetical protein VF678_13820 [bacterium]
MPASSYEAQQVLAELRKRLGLENKLPADPGVRVSTVTILEDDEPANGPVAAKPFAAVTASSPIDRDTYSPTVTRELERRAGSFMQPPVAPRQPAPPIPKTGKRPAPPPPPRDLGEAD